MIDYECIYKRYNKNSSWALRDFEKFCKEWDDICKKLNGVFRKEVNENEYE